MGNTESKPTSTSDDFLTPEQWATFLVNTKRAGVRILKGTQAYKVEEGSLAGSITGLCLYIEQGCFYTEGCAPKDYGKPSHEISLKICGLPLVNIDSKGSAFYSSNGNFTGVAGEKVITSVW
jgi:hypothetical protein